MSEPSLHPVGESGEPDDRGTVIDASVETQAAAPHHVGHLRVVAGGDDTLHTGAGAESPEAGLTSHEGQPGSSIPSPGEAQLRIRQLEQDLAAAQDEAEALHQMLEDLPEIYERKFRQRLQSVLEHQQHLQADNLALRERMFGRVPAVPMERPMLPPATQPHSYLGRRLREVVRQDREICPPPATGSLSPGKGE